LNDPQAVRVRDSSQKAGTTLGLQRVFHPESTSFKLRPERRAPAAAAAPEHRAEASLNRRHKHELLRGRASLQEFPAAGVDDSSLAATVDVAFLVANLAERSLIEDHSTRVARFVVGLPGG